MPILRPPINHPDPKEWCRQISLAAYKTIEGKLDNQGTVTLTENSATTTVTEAKGRIGQDTVILFMPTTANAATEFGAGTMYVSSRSVANNTFTITHVNNAQNDRTFKYVLFG